MGGMALKISKFSKNGNIHYHSMISFDFSYARLAQSVEHQTFNLRVAGSSPSSGDLFLYLIDHLEIACMCIENR